MARPPKNAAGPSATERMEMAFWDCLKEMPFSEITVRDIVTRAKVNRNSYYYHYESMWDLAQASIEHAKFAALALALLGDAPADDADAANQADAGFDHLRALASENGNQRLLEGAKQMVVGEWLAAFELDPETLPQGLRSSIDFMFGGLTALLASGHSENLETFKATIDGSELLASSVSMLRSELDPNAPSHGEWLQSSHMEMVEERVIIERTVEKFDTSEEIVEEISSAQENIQEPLDDSAKEELIEEAIFPQQEQEPAKKLSAESLVERMIEEEMHSEEVSGEIYTSESISEQVPEQEIQQQQETEHNHEGIPEQEPVDESQPEEDNASTQGVDDVLASEARPESQATVNSRQEPVDTHESETLPPWEVASVSNAEAYADAAEDILEEITENVAGFETTHAEVSELNDGPATDAIDEQAASVEPADDEPDESDEESQLSFDFLF